MYEVAGSWEVYSKPVVPNEDILGVAGRQEVCPKPVVTNKDIYRVTGW
jgi:hypothetical protein